MAARTTAPLEARAASHENPRVDELTEAEASRAGPGTTRDPTPCSGLSSPAASDCPPDSGHGDSGHGSPGRGLGHGGSGPSGETGERHAGAERRPAGPAPLDSDHPATSEGTTWWVPGSRRLRLSPAVPRLLRGATALQLGTGERARLLSGLRTEDWRTISLLERGISRSALAVDVRRRAGDLSRALRLVLLLAEADSIVPDTAAEPADPAGPGADEAAGPDTAGPDTAGQTTSSESVAPSPPTGVAARRLRSEAAVWAGVWPRSRSHPPEPSWSARERVGHRTGRLVAVVGGGGLGSVVATCLASSGVGQVWQDDGDPVTAADVLPGGPTADDVGRATTTATAAAVRRVAGFAPGVRGGPRPDLVVVVHRGAADATATHELVQEDVPHLSLVLREDDVAVGPLVIPGRSPCLHCLDQHRCDADPQWAEALRQLLAAPAALRTVVPALALTAAGVASLLALSHLDGRSFAPAGAAARVALPDGTVTWRSWHPHPRCGCVAVPISPPAQDDARATPRGEQLPVAELRHSANGRRRCHARRWRGGARVPVDLRGATMTA